MTYTHAPASIDLIGDRICLTVGPRDHELAKRIPGGNFKDGVWWFPRGYQVCLAARVEFGDSLVVGDALNKWGFNYLVWRKMAGGGDLLVSVTDERLLRHQVTGAGWLEHVGRGAVLDDRGLGKTITTIAGMRAFDLKRFLVISPATLAKNWAREIEKWFPEAGPATVVRGTPTQKTKLILDSTGPVVIGWEAMRTMSRLAPYGDIELSAKERAPGPLNQAGFEGAIFDEVHRAVDPHAKQTRAYWTLAHEVDVRMGATATPIVNTPEDIWSIMYGIVPYEVPWPRSKWIARYCLSGQGRYGWEVWGFNPHTKDELFAVLDGRLLRRDWESSGVEKPTAYPPQVREVDMEPKQRKAYDLLKKEMMLPSTDGGDPLVVKNPLELATRLVQAAAGVPVLEEVDGTDKEGNPIRVVKVVALSLPSAKWSAMLDILSDYKGEPLVVFTESRLLIDLIASQLEKVKVTYVRITGAEAPGARQDSIDKFQSGESRVALCTYGAGAEGITLTRANTVVRLQRSWSMVKNFQALGRVDRIGQTRPVQVIDVLTSDSIESRVWDAGEVKEGYLQEVLRDELR